MSTERDNTPREIVRASLLDVLGRQLPLTWGEPTSWSDGMVDVSIDLSWDEQDRAGHLVTISAGWPPPAAVQGMRWDLVQADTQELVATCRTDKRGQFTLFSDFSGKFSLRYVPEDVALARIAEALCQWIGNWLEVPTKQDAAHARKAEALSHRFPDHSRQDFQSPDGNLSVSLRFTAAGHLDIEVEVENLDSWGDNRLARFQVHDRQNKRLAEGYLGMAETGEGGAFGQLSLDVYAPDLPARLQPDCTVQVTEATILDEITVTPETLKKCHDATESKHGRAVLETLRRQVLENDSKKLMT